MTKILRPSKGHSLVEDDAHARRALRQLAGVNPRGQQDEARWAHLFAVVVKMVGSKLVVAVDILKAMAEGVGGAGAADRGQAVRQDRAHALAMRWRAVLACAVLILAAAGPAVAADEALWALLRAGGQVIMLRHAGTIGTVGDPPGFQIEDCSTQRNLTEAGREQARKIGEAFRAREIPIARVLSSPWCRCLDTARLAFGRVEPWWPLIGEPRAPDQIASRVRQIHEVLGTTPVGGNVVLVTHFVTVQDATGERIAEGELGVFTPRGDGQFTSVGGLAPGGLLCDPRSRLRPC